MKSARFQLEEANKAIFVKQYERAAEILDQIMTTDSGSDDLLVHLRRVELALRLGEGEALKGYYLACIADQTIDPSVSALALIFIDQHSNTITPSESLKSYHRYIEKWGESAAAYFGIALSLECQGAWDRAIYSYQQSLKLDESWYPSYFGLSQVYYQMEDYDNGDRNFHLFEIHAPYNLYGNIDTHRRLFDEFLARGDFDAARVSAATLSEWWVENRGSAPVEVQVFESLAMSDLGDACQDTEMKEMHLRRARLIVDNMMASLELGDDTLQVVHMLEKRGLGSWCAGLYQRVLQGAKDESGVARKIGHHLLTELESEDVGLEVFAKALHEQPDSRELRTCHLVASLKKNNVDREKYFALKERFIAAAASSNMSEVQTLARKLLDMFAEDSEIHAFLGDLYFETENLQQAQDAYERMYQLDSHSTESLRRYAAFHLAMGSLSTVESSLASLRNRRSLNSGQKQDVAWLHANFYARRGESRDAWTWLLQALSLDPWNISYLSLAIVLGSAHDQSDFDHDLRVFSDLIAHGDPKNWSDFDQCTASLQKEGQAEKVYYRLKARFLVGHHHARNLLDLVEAGIEFDPGLAHDEFLRLLNTNMDSPLIYYSLGVLRRESHQLETAIMWLERALLRVSEEFEEFRQVITTTLVDCYVWSKKNIDKAIELLKGLYEPSSSHGPEIRLTLFHAYLRKGMMLEARQLLATVESDPSYEARFLLGLFRYRNGQVAKAKEVWKPLLTHRSADMRAHLVKQELLSLYYADHSHQSESESAN